MASVENIKLTGKIALVTGASRGIGQAVAMAYARAGASVFACARGEADLSRVVLEVRNQGGEIHGCAGDVGRSEDVKCIVEKAVHRYGTVDVLVNNASLLGPRVAVADYPTEDWEEVLRINLTGPFLMAREVLATMLPKGQGSIINVSSGVGRIGKARWGAYAAAKFGVEGLTQVLAEEVKELGIRVNAINPGATRTGMRAAAYPDEDPLTLPTPGQITDVFVYLASDDSLGITGNSFNAQDWQR